jgi:DNA polymerase I
MNPDISTIPPSETIYIGDMETNGLRPDKIWCIILKEYQKEKYYGFVPQEYLEDSKQALPNVSFQTVEDFPSFVSNQPRLVFHNGCGFDFRVFRKLLNLTVTNYRDTYVMSKLASPKRDGGHSIEEWSKRLGTTDQKLQLEDSDWDCFSIKLLQRCYSDIRIGEAVYTALKRELKDTTLRALDIEQKTAWLVSDQIENGVKLDIPKVHQLYTDCKIAANKIQKDINKFFPPKPIQHEPEPYTLTKKGEVPVRLTKKFGLDLVGDSTPLEYETFNLDSPKQRVEKLLELGWQPLEFTKKTDKGGGGNPKFTEESLATIPENAPKELLHLADYLMLRSRERTFQQWLDGADSNDFIHGYVDPLGTRTQRMAHSAPNLGNIARTEYDKATKQPLLGLAGRYGYESRDCFVRSSPDRILVGCDAAGIQLRALAHYCEDPDYITLISDPSYDPHTTHAEALSLSRPLAKTWIYSWLMGAAETKLGSIVIPTEPKKLWRDRGAFDLEKFYKRFPFIKDFKKTLARWANRGYMFTLHGSKLEIPSEHLAMATALQSFEANIVKQALILYTEELHRKGILFWNRLIVHDEFLVETTLDKGDEVGKIIGQSIVESGEILKSKCPMGFEYKKGISWAECH